MKTRYALITALQLRGLHWQEMKLLTIQRYGHIITFMELNMIANQRAETQTYDQQIQIFKVLTHPARLAILEILRDGEHCVCHLEAHLGFRQAYISQQLSVLREAGIIQDRRDGWNIFYRVADQRIYEVLNAVRRITGQGGPEAKKPTTPCPCPQCSAQSVLDSK
jgi:DNA-binding transcriptional ArsR family regulator